VSVTPVIVIPKMHCLAFPYILPLSSCFFCFLVPKEGSSSRLCVRQGLCTHSFMNVRSFPYPPFLVFWTPPSNSILFPLPICAIVRTRSQGPIRACLPVHDGRHPSNPISRLSLPFTARLGGNSQCALASFFLYPLFQLFPFPPSMARYLGRLFSC